VPRSHGVDGVAESLVKSKKYLIPLVVLAPEFTGGVVIAYLVEGRLKLPKDAKVFEVNDAEVTDAPDVPATQPVVAAPGKPGQLMPRQPGEVIPASTTPTAAVQF